MSKAKRYLLVDDDDIISILHPAIIKRAEPEADIEFFNDSVLALNYLRELRSSRSLPPDFIFLDINMPFLGGFEFVSSFLEEDKKFLSNTKIIILSSSIDSKDLDRAKTFPIIDDFISKPLSIDYLKSLLKS
jgi:CheY-like chemotaxis protein